MPSASGLSRDQRVLAVVDDASIGAGEAQIGTVRDAAIERERGSVVNAVGLALKFIDGAELRDRPLGR